LILLVLAEAQVPLTGEVICERLNRPGWGAAGSIASVRRALKRLLSMGLVEVGRRGRKPCGYSLAGNHPLFNRPLQIDSETDTDLNDSSRNNANRNADQSQPAA
jgi:hypothetical protein